MLTAKKSSDALVIVLVHDIESVRYEHYLKLQDELKIFNAVDGLIVLNSKMNVWLKKHGVVVPMVNLEIWDYDNSNCFSEFSRYKRSICFAGSLDKSVFLNNINLKHKMYVFGTNPRHDYPECIEYMGSYSAEILPAHLNYNFGLVWDGTSVETCDGLMGEYLKINNPHKTSLYLSSGIPVIIWARAALADFVLKNKIGLTINSLSELDEKIDSISELEYENMHQNAVNIGKRMRDGYYIKKAVSQYTPAILRFK
nr:hypothetical protein [Liquorilactobacillus satsumensis]